MSQSNFSLKIGTDGTETKELYKSIDISLEMHQQKLAKINQQFSTLLGKTVMPFIVIQYPQDTENLEIFNFKGNDYDAASNRINNRLYQYSNPKGKDTIKLLKNTEKQFQKISKLNNSAWFKVQLYNPTTQHKTQDPLTILNRAKIQGNVQTDPAFLQNLTQIVRRISIQFLNSPIMAFLQLLEEMTVKLELSSIEQFPEQLRQALIKWLNFNEWVNKPNLHHLNEMKGELIIHITLPKLFSLKIKGDVSVFAVLLSAFP